MSPSTTAEAVRFAGAVREGGPRILYRNQFADRWVVVKRNPHTLDFGGGTPDGDQIVTQEFDDRDQALEAFVHSDAHYDPACDIGSADARHSLRSAVAEVHSEVLDVDADGYISNVEEMLTIIASSHGSTMRVRAAANRLLVCNTHSRAALPESSSGYATVTAPHTILEEDREPAVTAPANLGSSDAVAGDAVGGELPPIPLASGGHYRPRDLYGKTDVEVLRSYRGVDHVRLSGPPGAGKTSLPIAAFGDDIIYIQGHSRISVESLYGQYLPDDTDSSAQWRWVDGPLARAAKYGKVALIDEANRIPEDVHGAVLSVTDGRRQIVIDDRPDLPPIIAQPGFMVILTYNDVDHGTRPLPTALLRRFPAHIRVDTDYQVAEREGVDLRFILAAENLATRGDWKPQIADLLAAQRTLQLHGVQAAAALFVEACHDAGQHAVIRDVLTSVLGEPIGEANTLGALARHQLNDGGSGPA